MIHIDIAVQSDGWHASQAFGENRLYELAQTIVTTTFSHLGLQDTDSELSLVFTNDAEIKMINAEWRQKDKATNVLSFPAFAIAKGQKPGPLLGDIIIAEETVHREAQEENKDIEHHLLHLLAHGLLHLLGYDHETDAEAEEMEQLEREILQTLAISDPYAVSVKPQD